eukprot:m.19033 g.19033  ORF g.19033 m.19033 type:complete len:360 (+) comp10885_c0_seq1:160-1239(+)
MIAVKASTALLVPCLAVMAAYLSCFLTQLPPARTTIPAAFDSSSFPAYKLSSEQVKSFQRDGYLILRSVLPLRSVETLAASRPARMFVWWLYPLELLLNAVLQQISHEDALWSEHDVFYSLWKHSPCASLAAGVKNQTTARLLTDLAVGFYKHKRPRVLATYHQDRYSYNIISAESAGITVWIPLSNIDARTQGGSIKLVSNALAGPECRTRTADDKFSDACMQVFDEVAEVPDWKIGDVLLFAKDTIHRSQPFLPNATQASRFAVVGRFAVGSSRINLASPNLGFKLKMDYCNHTLGQGSQLNGPCFPQFYPTTLPLEEATRAQNVLGFPSAERWFLNEAYRMAHFVITSSLSSSSGL